MMTVRLGVATSMFHDHVVRCSTLIAILGVGSRVAHGVAGGVEGFSTVGERHVHDEH